MSETVSSTQQDGTITKLDHLWAVYERNVSSMSPRELARLLFLEFQRIVHKP